MEEVNLVIPHIELDNENWTAKIIVIEDMPTLTGIKSGAKYKRYVVVDGEGNEVLVIAFTSAISPVSNTLNLFGVFKITNAELREASKEYEVIGGNQIQWVLQPVQRSTLIRPMPLKNPYFIIQCLGPSCGPTSASGPF
ncbi:hypothetical protein LIER_27060 [Lithospermum erythrorhizon]|uniref:Uncharacterized protein n=1 Tax=Lithospermum erythrorhizon TaxID=34254 RepID=A0AAV3RDX5_LITER